jgi:ketosteroid isomerase-like protein
MDMADNNGDATTACREVVNRFYTSVSNGDLGAILDVFAENAKVSLAGQLEMCGTYDGRDRMAEWGAEVFGRLDPATWEVIRYRIFAVEPPWVCAISQSKAKSADGSLDYVPTYAQLFEIEDGRIIKFWEFADTALLEQLMGNRLQRPQHGQATAFEF